MTSRRPLRVLFGGGVVALIAGIALIAFGASPQPASFGWTSYSPLADTVYVPPGARVFSGTEIAGFAVLAAGLLTLVFWAGVTVGSRRSAHV